MLPGWALLDAALPKAARLLQRLARGLSLATVPAVGDGSFRWALLLRCVDSLVPLLALCFGIVANDLYDMLASTAPGPGLCLVRDTRGGAAARARHGRQTRPQCRAQLLHGRISIPWGSREHHAVGSLEEPAWLHYGQIEGDGGRRPKHRCSWRWMPDTVKWEKQGPYIRAWRPASNFSY